MLQSSENPALAPAQLRAHRQPYLQSSVWQEIILSC